MSSTAQMALADTRIAYPPDVDKHAGVLPYDLIHGNLIVQLRLAPRVLVGHSFGGKVAMSMVEQAAKPLARPVRVWVLDATPGKVLAGVDGEDHPAELIFSEECLCRKEVVDAFVKGQFSVDVAQMVNCSGDTPSRINRSHMADYESSDHRVVDDRVNSNIFSSTKYTLGSYWNKVLFRQLL